MPKLLHGVLEENMQKSTVAGVSGYQYSAVRPERLKGASEYTLVTIVLDFSGSVSSFAKDLESMLKTIISDCARSPRGYNLLVRVLLFSTSFSGGVEEVHGFKLLKDVDVNGYRLPSPNGGTPLTDCVYDAVAATTAYGSQLASYDFSAVNAITIVITDGEDNASNFPINLIAQEKFQGAQTEVLESHLGIVIGLNASNSLSQTLLHWQQEAGFEHYRDVGAVTKGSIAKLAGFIIQSISSQSQSVGSGGASQSIAAVI